MKKKRMIRGAVRGKETSPKTASLMVVYMLSKALAISPLEVYKMPISLVKDLLMVHTSVEELKSEEMDKISKKAESAKYGR
tara:strand:+ start:9631 stop:9873 length:243 start_codon:yes stop_codon:yes gene_type:complete